jgi:Bacterial Ig-like domain
MTREELIDLILDARTAEEIDTAEVAVGDWMREHPDDVGIAMAAEQLEMMRLALTSVAWAAPGPPTVVRTVPANGATNVDVNANVKVKFSEEMKEKSINTGTFYLTAGAPSSLCSTTTVPATVRYKDDTKTAVLNPTDPLDRDAVYTATVEGTGDGDMKAVKDRGDTPMATDYIFSFTTGTVCEIC